jgi:hypothetical protein
VALVQSGAATHALTLAPDAVALAELAPLPHAVGLAANWRNMDAARSLLDWLSARATTSPAPSLDVEWATGQYVATRQRWAQGGFAPGVTG